MCRSIKQLRPPYLPFGGRRVEPSGWDWAAGWGRAVCQTLDYPQREWRTESNTMVNLAAGGAVFGSPRRER